MHYEQSRSSPRGASSLVACGTAPEAAGPPGPAFRQSLDAGDGDTDLRQRRIRHDIRHELGTIMMLAQAVAISDDVGPKSRERVEALIGETRWLDHLLRQLDQHDESAVVPRPALIRVDEVVGEVVAGLRLSSVRGLGYISRPSWARIDPLALWRALRNVLDNACRIAADHVDVEVGHDGGWTVIQVDDDGPGFGGGSDGLASLGLGIVHELVSEYGGGLEIRQRDVGGACVRILLPSVGES